MAKGELYFAWIDPTETVFGPEHMRRDENVFSFSWEHAEGEFATLTLDVKRPQNAEGDSIGLLTPGRKQWAWFAFDCGPALKKFRGRLVGIPSSIFREIVTLEFVARPIDYVEQKDAVADTLRVLPGYDPIFVDEQAREDPDLVLEGYSKIWHIDPETHVVSVSDEIIGEDGLVEIQPGDMLYNGFDCTISGEPLTTVHVDATLEWTQGAIGGVDMTAYVVGNWPNEDVALEPGTVTSFTLNAESWPKIGASMGDGWTVTDATCVSIYDTTVQSKEEGGSVTVKWDDDTVTVQSSASTSRVRQHPPGSIGFPKIKTSDNHSIRYSSQPGEPLEATSMSKSSSFTGAILPLNHLRPTLTVGYEAERGMREHIRFTLTSDMQAVVTLPGDDAALDIELNSSNLSEVVIEEGITSGPPIGDARRRSYVCTPRGEQSLQHLIARARAHLLKRSRVVELTCEPMLARMPEITLRKNGLIHDKRLPGGQAQGKFINCSLALDGSSGAIECAAKIACPVGRGGAAVATEGDPIYVDADYIGPEADHQEYIGRTVLFDTSVGYSSPLFAPNDDGIDFITGATPASVLERGLMVEHPPAQQREAIMVTAGAWVAFERALPPPAALGEDETPEQAAQKAVKKRSEAIGNTLELNETKATFKLKSMTAEFDTDYDIAVTDLKVPAGINLEAAP